MSYQDILQDSLDALRFESDGVKQIQSNTDAVTFGVISTIIAGVATAVGSLNPFGLITNPIGLLIGLFIGGGVLHLFAKLFGGQGSFRDFFSVLTNGQILFWITVIPIVGPFLSLIAGLYNIAFQVFAIKEVHKLSVGKSVLVWLLPAIILIVVGFILALFAGALLATLGLGALTQVAA